MDGLIYHTAPLAIGISLSPMANIAVIVLPANGNRRGGLWFLVSWVAGLLVLTSLVAVFGQSLQSLDREFVAPWLAPGEIIVGAAVVVWALVSLFRNRNAPPPRELPKVLRSADVLGAVGSFGMASLMAGFNAKNVALLLVFLLALVSTARPLVWTDVSIISFILFASLTIATPVLYAVIKGPEADPLLNRWRTWMTAHQGTIMNSLLASVGLVLIARGLTK